MTLYVHTSHNAIIAVQHAVNYEESVFTWRCSLVGYFSIRALGDCSVADCHHGHELQDDSSCGLQKEQRALSSRENVTTKQVDGRPWYWRKTEQRLMRWGAHPATAAGFGLCWECSHVHLYCVFRLGKHTNSFGVVPKTIENLLDNCALNHILVLVEK